MEQVPWLALWPCFALTITVYSLNMFGDAVRDLLDPRLRGGQESYGTAKRKTAKRGFLAWLEKGVKSFFALSKVSMWGNPLILFAPQRSLPL